MKKRLFFLALICSICSVFAGEISISSKEAAAIGRKIWQNESGGTIDGLTAWNAGEEFPSLGIGHFIWYPPGKKGPFEESFPKLIEFLRHEGVALPAFLTKTADAPWRTKAEFDREFHSGQTTLLREFLAR